VSPSILVPSQPSVGRPGYVLDGYPELTSAEVGSVISEFNAQDLATLFQDSALTIPVAAANDPVGGIDAVLDFIQATAGQRPTYAPTGIRGLPALQFAGASSQNLGCSGIATALTGDDTPFSVAVLVQVTTPTSGNQNFFSLGNTGSTDPFNFMRIESNRRLFFSRRATAAAGSKTTPTSANTALTAGVPAVVVFRFAGTQGDIWVNGVQAVALSDLDVATMTLNRATVGALGQVALSQFLTGFIGRFAVFGKLLSVLEVMGLTLNFRRLWQV
jgi:hypothetical protein